MSLSAEKHHNCPTCTCADPLPAPHQPPLPHPEGAAEHSNAAQGAPRQTVLAQIESYLVQIKHRSRSYFPFRHLGAAMDEIYRIRLALTAALAAKEAAERDAARLFARSIAAERVSAELRAERDAALSALDAAQKEIARLTPKPRAKPQPTHECEKCGGFGWVWGHELDEPPDRDPSFGPDDTRYSCDGEGCRSAGRGRFYYAALSEAPGTEG